MKYSSCVCIGFAVKEFEDLTAMQNKLLNKLRGECKALNEQLESIALKYKYAVKVTAVLPKNYFGHSCICFYLG